MRDFKILCRVSSCTDPVCKTTQYCYKHLAELAPTVAGEAPAVCDMCEVPCSGEHDLCDKCIIALEAPLNPTAQVGGTHYGDQSKDVVSFSLHREHDCMQHNAIKYIDRHKLKNGKEDIEKAISYLHRILKEQYNED